MALVMALLVFSETFRPINQTPHVTCCPDLSLTLWPCSDTAYPELSSPPDLSPLAYWVCIPCSLPHCLWVPVMAFAWPFSLLPSPHFCHLPQVAFPGSLPVVFSVPSSPPTSLRLSLECIWSPHEPTVGAQPRPFLGPFLKRSLLSLVPGP